MRIKLSLTIVLMLALLSCNDKGLDTAKSQDQTSTKRVESTAPIIPFVEKYPNGQIKTEGQNQDGKKVGKWISYHKDGKIWSEGEYQYGERNGIFKTFFDNGILRYRGAYVNDLRQGPWYFYNDTGKIEKQVEFHRGEVVEK